MADLRLVVLGCLMLVAFVQSQQICELAKPGEILEACLFTHKCPVSTIVDVKMGLLRDLKSLKQKLKKFEPMFDCASTIESTGTDGLGGCCDKDKVEKTGCKQACDAVMRLLPYNNRC